eukprot:766012-Hanusia_phi.AAC.3
MRETSVATARARRSRTWTMKHQAFDSGLQWCVRSSGLQWCVRSSGLHWCVRSSGLHWIFLPMSLFASQSQDYRVPENDQGYRQGQEEKEHTKKSERHGFDRRKGTTRPDSPDRARPGPAARGTLARRCPGLTVSHAAPAAARVLSGGQPDRRSGPPGPRDSARDSVGHRGARVPGPVRNLSGNGESDHIGFRLGSAGGGPGPPPGGAGRADPAGPPPGPVSGSAGSED